MKGGERERQRERERHSEDAQVRKRRKEESKKDRLIICDKRGERESESKVTHARDRFFYISRTLECMVRTQNFGGRVNELLVDQPWGVTSGQLLRRKASDGINVIGDSWLVPGSYQRKREREIEK